MRIARQDRHRGQPRRFFRRALLPAACVILVGAVLAPPGGAGQPDSPLSAAAVDPVSPEARVARRLLQYAARFEPWAHGEAADPALGFAARAALLSHAAALDPDSATIQRELALAAEATGEAWATTATEARRQWLRLEPRHALNQLAVIAESLRSRQSAEDRLATLERLLGSESAASRLDAGVRSRLAFEAALLRQEQGRAQIANELLERALRLDPTNLDAAALRALEIDRQTALRERLVAAMIDLVKADPTNLNAIVDLAAALQDAGAFRAALDLMPAVAAAAERQGVASPRELVGDSLVMLAALDGPERALQAMEDLIASGRAAAPPSDPGAARQLAAGERTLTVDAQLTRLTLANLVGREAVVDDALAAVDGAWQETIAALDAVDPATLTPAATEAMATERRRARVDRVWLRVWADRRLDEAAALLAELENDPHLDPGDRARLRGWLAFRQGDLAGAESILRSVSEEDPFAAAGVALVFLTQERRNEALRLLQTVAADRPGTLLGVWASLQLRSLTQREAVTPPAVRTIERLMEGVPQALTDLLTRPHRYVALTLRAANPTAGPSDPLVVEITLRNDGPWPLAIGPGRVLSGRIALLPVVLSRGGPSGIDAPPLEVDLRQRFVLRPGESLTVPLDLQETTLGLVLSDLAVRPVTLRLQGVTDYEFDETGGFTVRPWSLIRESNLMEIKPWTLIDDAGRTLAERVDAGVGESDAGGAPRFDFDAIAAIGSLVAAEWLRDSADDAGVGPEAQGNAPAVDEQRLAALDRLIAAWPEMDDLTRAWVVLNVPGAAAGTPAGVAERVGQLDRLVMRSETPLIQATWIAARTASAEDVVLLAARRSEDPAMRRLAEAVSAYLAPATPDASDGGAETQPEDAGSMPAIGIDDASK